ncbi:hypothetical protein CLAFUW4_10361 [Fulvia fulva]|uniref:Uncharacterized protein n=1 Tax=Passalora fulva TaxID=5499 RepID=A0A9Q8LFF1_PASFU|nr:uncharacterized protein CLAFUR5_04975 [Fulvia fulva]KAK4615792.1 hypothetical protein CLAFUR4_10365 [Fulvia fulva]KAK4616883.1 hypothetical protein CLAFUR0_10365 [Fulvia fulva]UJO16414.1 hypothetical protein CLAFUR5_04975 [Fulvia fulva]WPV18963.1 hypothetical protein CLAFUW4_10361 [Fulvia fulva]WPV33977.1 hypothetical protein CLAFUW7_10361 [Fulvia fulva]
MTADHLITDPTLLSVLRAAEEARRQCLELTDLIAQNHAEEPSDEQFDAQRKLNARLALLRGLNRNAVKSVRTTKQETTEARQEIDSLHLELQNLYYEQGHLRGEIRGCEGFDHKYTRLPMISTEEFIAQHPEHADSNEHDLTLARIADEHAARQELEKQRQELGKRKEALVKETNLKKEELGRLDNEVEKWLGGQENVRKVFEKRAKEGI